MHGDAGLTAALPVLVAALLGLRWPGLFLAAAFFGYPAGVFSGVEGLTSGVTVLGIGIMLLGVVTRRQPVRLYQLDFLYVAFLSLTVFSASWSPADQAMVEVTRFALPVGALYLLIRLVFAFGDPDRRLSEFFVGVMICGSFYAARIISMADSEAVRFRLEDQGNVAVGLTQSLVVAAIVTCAHAISGGPRWRLLYLAALAMMVYAIILTGTRGAFLTVGAGMGFYVVRVFGLSRLAGGVLLGTPILLLVVVVFIGPERLDALSQIRVFNFSSYGSAQDASSAIRFLGYVSAWQVFAEHPVFGAGLGAFDALTPFSYPHNIVLELLTNTGLVGLVPAIAMLVMTVAIMRDARFDTPLRACLLALIFAAFVHHQISFNLITGKPLYLFLALPSLLYGSRPVFGRDHDGPDGAPRVPGASGSALSDQP